MTFQLATQAAPRQATVISIETVFGSKTANDTFTGNATANRFEGFGGSDVLSGLSGNDTLNGGDGIDGLRGSGSRDVLIGGAHADDFNYASVGESGTTASTRDLINDFEHLVDDIDVSAIDARAGSAGNNAFTFKGAAVFTAEGQVRAYQAGSSSIVELNTIGTDGAEMVLQLNNFTASNLTAADIVL